MKILKNTLCFILLLFFTQSVAQTDRTFWFVVPEVSNGTDAYFNISTLSLPATVTISIPANGLFTPIEIEMEANSSVRRSMSAYVNDMENKPANSVEDRGILIQSTQLITVYYEINEGNNRDIFVLKGQNALGTSFFTPFQDLWDNNGAINSTIDIVATQDGTNISIDHTVPVTGSPVSPLNFSLDSGQTFSCRALNPNGVLSGTEITANNPIAVTISDDQVYAAGEGNCTDLIGDQLVPVNNIGNNYIISRSKEAFDVPGDDVHESVYIVATQPATSIYIDTVSTPVATIGTGNTYSYELSDTLNGTHIWGTAPIYVLHVYAFGCQMGGAIVPTIDGCTGSYEVSFTRPTTSAFYLNLHVENGFPKNAFWLEYENGTLYNIPETSLENVGASGWMTLKDNDKNFADNDVSGIPRGQVTRIYNTKGRFHVGIMSGNSSEGCKYGYLSDFSVNRGIGEIADLHLDSTQQCYGDSIQLLAFGGTEYFWNTYPSEQPWIAYLTDRNIGNPKAFLAPDTTYDYRVKITRPCLGDTTMRVVIDVPNQIEALFSVDYSEGCADLEVNVTDGSINAVVNTYEWIFETGDTTKATTSPGPHTYNNDTTIILDYDLKLVVKNDDNCPDTLIRTISVSPFITADFTPAGDTDCNPLEVQFVNNTTGGNMTGVIYEWDFGDESSSFESDPLHIFQNTLPDDTTFTSTLVAKSIFNCTDTVDFNFTVYDYIKAEFELDTVVGCSPFTVDLEAVTYPGISSYDWDYGNDSTRTGADPLPLTYENNTAGIDTFFIKLLVQNADGCEDSLIRQVIIYPEVEADFSLDSLNFCNATNVTFTNDSDPWVDSYDWDFGDGGTSNDENPVHFYENPTSSDTIYVAQLAVATALGCVDTFIRNITIHSFIEANFIVEDAIGCAPFVVDVVATTYPGISNYNWDFGDTFTPVGADPPPHPYQNATGAILYRNLELVVDNGDCTDTLIRQITVYPEVIAGFEVNTDNGCHPLEVEFTDTSTITDPATYDWDFGDGVFSTEKDPVHSFSNFDIVDVQYTVQLITSSDYNCSDTATQVIDVYHNARSNFTINKTFDCPPLDVVLTNTSEGADSYNWNFGDGENSTSTHPTYSYDNVTSTVNSYNLRLIAETVNGCDDTTGLIVSVYPRVTADYEYDDVGCSPFEVDFTNTSTNADSYFWDFDDGVTSGAENPTNQFYIDTDTDVDFSVRLIASSDYDCKDTIDQIVTVYPTPNVEFFVNPVHQLYYDPSADVLLENMTLHQSSWDYEWNFGDGNSSTTDEDEFTHSYTDWAPVSDDFAYSITLRAYTSNCSNEVTHDVYVAPPIPEVDIIDENPQGCAPLTVNFSVETNYADSFIWNFDDGTTSTEMEPTHTFETPGVYYVELEAIGEGGSRSDFQEVRVDRNPIADFWYAPNIFYLGGDTLFVNSKSLYANTYLWNFGDGTTSEEDTTYHVYTAIGVYDLSLTVSTTNGCEDSKTVESAITVAENNLIFPNAFTPYSNDDKGINEVFRPAIFDDVEEFYMAVYNKWGNKLFETHDVNIGWDGKYKGKLCDQDVYIWTVKGKHTNGAPFVRTGDVTLVR